MTRPPSPSSALVLRTVLVLAVATVLLGQSTAVPVRWHADDTAELRLSFTARPERIETCRTLRAEEVDARPVHMRRERECRGETARYRLYVVLDGHPQDSAVLTGGGLRHDRPIHLLRRYHVDPGVRSLHVSLRRLDAAPDTGVRTASVLPPTLVLDTTVHLARGRARLVSFDGSRLVLRP